jgi:hypothetical protein
VYSLALSTPPSSIASCRPAVDGHMLLGPVSWGHMSPLAILSLANSVARSAAFDYSLVGLTPLHSTPPGDTGFATISVASGNLTLLGPPLAGVKVSMGGLRAVDKRRGVYYFLGAGHSTVLVGVDIATGVEVCRSQVPIKEPSFVGLGQSLDYDTARDRLILSGLVGPNSTGAYNHQVLTASLGGTVRSWAGCGQLVKAGTFGIAVDMPMIHSSAYDEATQTLYVTVNTNKTAFALAVIDVASQTLKRVFVEGHSFRTELWGMSWNADTGKIIGLMQNFGLTGESRNGHGVNLMSLDPTTMTWEVRPLQNLGRPNWDVNGNNGMVAAFDPANGFYYALFSAGVASALHIA